MQLDAQWIVGFVDGEGCFHVSVNAHPEMSAGAQVLPEFTVVQHERDVQVLHALKGFFGCGVVRKNHGDRMAYRVRGHEHLLKNIIPFFEKHPLKSRKRVEFIKFREIVNLMGCGEHLTREGVDRIRAIANQMNRKGLKVKSDQAGNGLE
jgi:LAGLIDADG endonuclease